MAESPRIGIRLEPPLLLWLETLASRQGITISQLIRDILKREQEVDTRGLPGLVAQISRIADTLDRRRGPQHDTITLETLEMMARRLGVTVDELEVIQMYRRLERLPSVTSMDHFGGILEDATKTIDQIMGSFELEGDFWPEKLVQAGAITSAEARWLDGQIL